MSGFNSKSDKENYFREKILLFLPWRNEATDMFGCYKTYKQHYETRKYEIDKKCKIYEHHVEELEMARLAAECDDNAYDDVAPSAQEQEAEAAMEEPIYI